MKIVALFCSVFLLFKFEYALADEANSRDLFRSILDQNVIESVKKGKTVGRNYYLQLQVS